MKKFYAIFFTLTMMIVPTIAFGNVIDKLNEAGKFTKLNETLSKSGLSENLKGKGPFTVFAPLDDAFAAISAQTYYGLLREDNKDKLVNILGRHVFSKKITSSDIDNEIKLKAINGEEVTANSMIDAEFIDGKVNRFFVYNMAVPAEVAAE